MTRIYIPAAGWYTLEGGPTPPDPPIPPDPPQPIPGDVISVPWSRSETWHIPMQCTQTLIFVLDVPPDAVPGPYPNQFNFAEYQGPATTRQVVLSHVMGSFDLAYAVAAQQGTQVSLPVLVGSNVNQGQRYFINVRNWSTDLNGYSCAPGQVMGSIASWITS